MQDNYYSKVALIIIGKCMYSVAMSVILCLGAKGCEGNAGRNGTDGEQGDQGDPGLLGEKGERGNPS